VGAIALPGHIQEGGHDVGHHPVDIKGQTVQRDSPRPEMGEIVHGKKIGDISKRDF
jgi:hypothetical protein